jgi:ribosome biogenesis protein UTP30
VQALHAHESKKSEEQHANDLLGPKEQAVWLVVAVKKMYPERKLKPFRMCAPPISCPILFVDGKIHLIILCSPVQHPLVDPRTTGVCLICKDPQREYKDLLDSHGIKFISRVVGIAKLKGKFKPFEARRLLLKEHGLFLADERVIPLLPTLLGKKWFEAKK